MNLEQRLAAVEAELAGMKSQQKTAVEISELMRKITIETIKNEQRPGGFLFKSSEKAANARAAESKTYYSNMKLGVTR